MRVSSLDLSFTSTGGARLVLGSAAPPVVTRFETADIKKMTRDQWFERLNEVKAFALGWAYGADLVALEGPAYNRPQGQHQYGGLWYQVANELWLERIPFVVITPAQVKQYALGKGAGKGTDKDFVVAAVVRRYPFVLVNNNDEVDALVLAAMCADYYGCPIAPVPLTHRKGLEKVEWVPRERILSAA